jgi:hypothetical protein
MKQEMVRTTINVTPKMHDKILRHGEEIGSYSLTETVRDLLNKGLVFHRQMIRRADKERGI